MSMSLYLQYLHVYVFHHSKMLYNYPWLKKWDIAGWEELKKKKRKSSCFRERTTHALMIEVLTFYIWVTVIKNEMNATQVMGTFFFLNITFHTVKGSAWQHN